MMKHSVSSRLSSAMVRVAAIQGLGAKCICHPFLGFRSIVLGVGYKA